MKKLIYIIFTLLLLSPVAISQEIWVNAEVDTNVILIGEQFTLSLQINKPRDVQIDFPEIEGQLDPKIEVIEKFPIDSAWTDNNNLKISQQLILTSFDTGFYTIPPLPFEIEINNVKDTIFSQALPLGVFTMQLDTSQAIFDIKKQAETPLTFKELLPYWWIPSTATLLLIIVFVLFYYYKNEKKIFIKPAKPLPPAHVEAFANLDLLKKEKLWQQNRLKEYYSKLTEILRRYIERRYEVKALEQTSSEIIDSFSKNKLIDSMMIDELRSLLSLADFVKFAKGSALPDENEKNFEKVRLFVEKTKETMNYDQENNTGKKVTEPEKATE